MTETLLQVKALDENTRRYYLEVMGIQCWEQLDTEKQRSDDPLMKNAAQLDVDNTDGDRDVASSAPLFDKVNWPLLEINVQQCNKCQLHKKRKQAILGRGNKAAELMIILLSPDMVDDASGELCGGEAYQLLSKMLNAIDIAIDDVYITSLLKCGVPVNYTITANELHQCGDYLKQQIQYIRPRQLVLLGETAVRCLSQDDMPLDDLRALINTGENNNLSVLDQYVSVPLLVSYSPQELLQRPENKRKAWLDLQQLQKMMRSE
jgi:DNA polymerase